METGRALGPLVGLLPADFAAFVLFLEPAHQRLEVFHHCASRDVFAGNFL